MALVFVFLYAPIVLLIVFSFNSGNSNMVWKGFSLHWYTKLFRNRIIMQSVYTTLLVSLLATLIATVAGTFAAIGFYAMRRKPRETLMAVNNIPMMNTQGAVVLGMVYNYLPFMILPIYSVIIKLDGSLLEAARDLGASSMTVFRRVILPLSLPGVISGITMVFVPSVSTFAISRMLGGGTELLLGDLIERQFLGGAYNPQLGAAISLVMMIIVLVCMLVMNRFGEGEEQAVML